MASNVQRVIFSGNSRNFAKMERFCKSSLFTAAVIATFVIIFGSGGKFVGLTISSAEKPGDRSLTEGNIPNLMEKFDHEFHSYLTGIDNDGSPVFILEIGKFKFTTIREGEAEDFVKFLQYIINTVVEQAAIKSRTGVVYIMDFDGCSLENFNTPRALGLALQLFQLTDRIFPVIKYGIRINENPASNELMNALGTFLADFGRKFHTLGKTRDEWVPKLLEQVHPSQLAPKYGGFKREEFHG